jgi:hypothetical protein
MRSRFRQVQARVAHHDAWLAALRDLHRRQEHSELAAAAEALNPGTYYGRNEGG